MTDRPTVAVDLDGVLNRYDGWRGEDHYAAPLPGAQDFLARLYTKYRIVILTTRDAWATRDWLNEHNLSPFISYVSDRKVPAVAYLDDRAVRFTGDYEETIGVLTVDDAEAITPWWKREGRPCPHGDATCPCQDGDPCHYESDANLTGSAAIAMPCPTTGLVDCDRCPGARS